MLQPAGESVCALFERQADRTPDAPAVLCGNRLLTYAELEAEVNRLARHLREDWQVGPGSLVGLLLERSERMLISILGVLKAGGAYLPISPEYPQNRLEYLIHDADPALMLTERAGIPLLAGTRTRLLSWDDRPPAWVAKAADRPPWYPDPHDLVYVMYTSGSTGFPKGVMQEHDNLSNFIVWCGEEYRDSVFDVVYAITPYGFDLSNLELFFPLTVGSRIRMLPSSQMMGLYLRRDRNVLVNTVPSLIQQILRTDGILRNVSVLNLGGEAIPPALGQALRSHPDLEIRNMYGPTETTSTAINYRMDGAPSSEVLIGKPIANTSVYIVDDGLRPLPDNVRGEIVIGGRGVGRGYLNQPQLTRARFIDDAPEIGERVYRTGDLGMRLPDGNFRYLGRNDNQVKIRGFRIELDEIGNHLLAHPEVKDAVVGVRKTAAGDTLIAFVVSASSEFRADPLRAFLREQLPPYMVPTEFMAVDSFPLTPSGKIDRSALFAPPDSSGGAHGTA